MRDQTASAFYLEEVLSDYNASPTLIEMLPRLDAILPPGVDFAADTWDLLPWVPRPGQAASYNILWNRIQNHTLRNCVKVFALHKRLTAKVNAGTMMINFTMAKSLDKAIGPKPVKLIRNADFYKAEEIIKSKHFVTSPFRHAMALREFGGWLNWQLGLPISFEPQDQAPPKYGRKGSEEGRQEKLMSTQVIHDMIASNSRTDLSEKDRFYLSAFVILVATGFRINELATMPRNCLYQENGVTGLRYFPEKHGELGTKFIASDMVPAVLAALEYITVITEPGRAAVDIISRADPINWSTILDDPEATEYFVGKFAHEWTSDPNHRMINPNGAWLEKEKRFVDVIELIGSSGSKSAAARALGVKRPTIDGLLVAQLNAQEGILPSKITDRGKSSRTSWDTDTRVISLMSFNANLKLNIHHKQQFLLIKNIITEAQRLQLAGNIYPVPPYNQSLEDKFKRTVRPVIVDKDGKSILEPEDALFVTLKNGFSDQRGTVDEDYRLITSKAIGRWFDGEKRSHGTGNHEDSCFRRLEIYDPKTGDIAEYTSHDIRHWLDSIYAEGKMDECTIALVFGRKISSNHTYDQTSKKQRLENLRQAVRNGNVLGHIASTYSRLASYSREDAEQFLIAYTLMINIMPHGACTLNWGLEPCPHHLGCFTKNGGNIGPCEHFLFDKNDPTEVVQVKRIAREVEVTLRNLPKNAPQYLHYHGISENLSMLLDNCWPEECNAKKTG